MYKERRVSRWRVDHFQFSSFNPASSQRIPSLALHPELLQSPIFTSCPKPLSFNSPPENAPLRRSPRPGPRGRYAPRSGRTGRQALARRDPDRQCFDLGQRMPPGDGDQRRVSGSHGEEPSLAPLFVCGNLTMVSPAGHHFRLRQFPDLYRTRHDPGGPQQELPDPPQPQVPRRLSVRRRPVDVPRVRPAGHGRDGQLFLDVFLLAGRGRHGMRFIPAPLLSSFKPPCCSAPRPSPFLFNFSKS